MGVSEYPLALDQMLANEERLLRELIEICEGNGIKLVLIPINPFYYQTKNQEKNGRLSRWAAWQGETLASGDVIEKFNDVLVRVAQEYRPRHDVYLFDVRQYLDDQDREPLYADFIHHSAQGSQRVAQGLFEFMKNMDVVDLPPH